MRRYSFIALATFVLCLSSLSSLKACDICGSGVGSYYLGILPDFNKRFVGLRYQYKTLQTHLGPSGNRTPNTADETYQSMELWGAWNFGAKWRIMAIVPYNFNKREVANGALSGTKEGLGDIALMGYYKLFEVNTTVGSKFLSHSLWGGAGVKTPTGKYDNEERSSASQDAPNNFQLGTASTDFMLNLAYDIRLMDLGINTNIIYKINTENKYEYRYGNKFTANVLAYYKFNVQNKLRIAPNAGVIYETQPKDVVYNRFDVTQSGGYSTAGIGGIELNIGKISFGGNYQFILSQELASGRAKSGDRVLTHISYAF